MNGGGETPLIGIGASRDDESVEGRGSVIAILKRLRTLAGNIVSIASAFFLTPIQVTGEFARSLGTESTLQLIRIVLEKILLAVTPKKVTAKTYTTLLHRS